MLKISMMKYPWLHFLEDIHSTPQFWANSLQAIFPNFGSQSLTHQCSYDWCDGFLPFSVHFSSLSGSCRWLS